MKKDAIKKSFCKSLSKGKIENFKKTSKGCTFKMPMSKEESKIIEDAFAAINKMMPYNCISMHEMKDDEVFCDEYCKKEIQKIVDMNNEFADFGSDLIFEDDLYVELELYDSGERIIYICKRKDEHLTNKQIREYVEELFERYNNNGGILWKKEIYACNKKYTDLLITKPKITALEFEAWKRLKKNKLLKYDDLKFSFVNDEYGIAYLQVEFADRFVEKLNKYIKH